MVHVDETISADKMHELEDVVRGDACVISACSAHDNPHVLLVTYNPDCTHPGDILHRVQSQGIHAELVGL
jgi:fructose-1,6-bisphosphatase/sedoheptulose 1,7-bisphosphatase-like protein